MRLLNRASLVIAAAVFAASACYAALPSSGRMEHLTIRKMGAKASNVTQITSWSGAKFRVESSTGKRKSVILSDGKKVYFYDPAAKSAMSTSQKPNMGKRLDPAAELLSSAKAVAKRGKKIGMERVGPYNCDIYTFQHPMTKTQKVSRKIWINKDTKLPIEVKSVVSVGDKSVTRMLRRVKLGVKNPDSLFVLPKGTKIAEHPDMPMNPHGQGRMPDPHKK